jgi:crossover junction endodeoxyribonuclease RuvC
MSELMNSASPFAMKTALGVDVGVTGALSLIGNDGSLIECEDMPVLADGPDGRRTINGGLLADIVRRWSPSRAIIESVSARPGEGATGAFAFGRSYGTVMGVLSACGVPWSTLTPPQWRRIIGFPTGTNKDLSRSEAIRRWPSQAGLFARVKDDGRAEAALIAVAGMMREAR